MPLSRLPNKYEEAAQIDFDDRETVFEGYVANTTKHVADAVNAIQANVINQVKRRKILQKKDYRGAMTLKVNIAPIKAIMLNSFMYVYLTGKHDAKKEIEAGLGHKIRFAADIATIKPIEGMEQFRRKIPITKTEFSRMVGREKNKAFTVAGVIEADMVKNVQTLVDRAIDQGWGVNDLQFALKKANVEYTGTVYGTDAKKGEPLAPYHTETILRTNFADVYSKGRDAMFNDPDVVEFLPAFMYSAILDSRVRESHAAMDGRIYERDDPIWSEWTPPNGYNCRCIKTPITSNQEFSVSEPTEELPDTGFGGRVEAVTPIQADKRIAGYITEQDNDVLNNLIKELPDPKGFDPSDPDSISLDTRKLYNSKRQEYLKLRGVDSKTIKTLEEYTGQWVKSSTNPESVKLMMINNKLAGRTTTAFMEDSLKKKLSSELLAWQPSEELLRASSLFRQYNQKVFIKVTGNPTVTSFRGISGKYADDIRDAARMSGSPNLEIPIRPLHSETVWQGIAEEFMEDTGVMYGRMLDVETQLWDSFLTSSKLQAYEREIMAFDGETIQALIVGGL